LGIEVSNRVVVGVGLSSAADAAEVRALIEQVLRQHELELAQVTVIATRQCFVADERLRLGPPVIGFSDAELEEKSEPCDRTVGITARVAETAARLAGGTDDGDTGSLTPAARSPHVTVALRVV
jgi:cobalamin biosynthesis protein CbiG